MRLDNRAFGKAVTTLHSHTAHLAQARDRNAAGTPDAAGEYDSTARTCWCVIYARADGEGRRADRGEEEPSVIAVTGGFFRALFAGALSS